MIINQSPRRRRNSYDNIQNNNYKNNIKPNRTTSMTNYNSTNKRLYEKQQMKSILDKLQHLTSNPPLFFVYCNDVDIVNNFSSAITTILTLAPRALSSSAHIDNPSHVLLALSNASSLLSSVIDTLISVNGSGTSNKRKNNNNTTKRSTMTMMLMMSKNNTSSNNNNNNNSMLSRTVGRAMSNRKSKIPTIKTTSTSTTANAYTSNNNNSSNTAAKALSSWSTKLADTVQREANAILNHVDRVKDVIETTSNTVYNKIVAAGCFDEKYECNTPQSVHLALIAHAHQLIDALLAFNGNTTESEWIAHSTKHGNDAPHRQHQVVNGQLGTGAISNETYRRSADLSRSNQYHQYHDSNRTLKRKSAETAGSRFMRSLSSSFRNSTASSSTKSTSVDYHETPPRSSKSSTVSFSDSSFALDEHETISWTMKIKPEENASSISTQSISQRSTTSTSTNTSTSKNAIRTFFGSATTIVRHGRDHQISPSTKKTSIIPTIKHNSNNNDPNHSGHSTITWRHLFKNNYGSSNNDNNSSSSSNKNWKFEKNPSLILDEDSSCSSATSISQNRLSFTSDHVTETVKLYPSNEKHRWSCGDDAKYSAAEISKYNNNFYRINSRRLSSEQRKRERYAATFRLKNSLMNNKNNNNSTAHQQLHPKVASVFRQMNMDESLHDNTDTTLLSTDKTELDSNAIQDNNIDSKQYLDVDYHRQVTYRPSLSDDDDDLEMLTMGTYGPLTPISILDSPTSPPQFQSSPTAINSDVRLLDEAINEEEDHFVNNTTSPTTVENAGNNSNSHAKEEANLDRMSTRSSSYFSARSFSSHSSLHSARSGSQSRMIDLEMAKYHTNHNANNYYAESAEGEQQSVSAPSSPTLPNSDDRHHQQQMTTMAASVITADAKIDKHTTNANDVEKIVDSLVVQEPKVTMPIIAETKPNHSFATISASMVTHKKHQRSPSTLLSKAMMFAEGRSSSDEPLYQQQQQQQQPQQQTVSSTYHRSVGTISNISSVFSRHWSPYKKAASIQGSNKNQAKTTQQQTHQRRNPIPFSTSDGDMTSESSIRSSLSIHTSRDTSYRTLDIDNRIDFMKPNDELNHIWENGHITLITQPVSGDKQKVIAGTGAQLFKKLLESATHDLDYVDTYLLSHLAFISSTQLFDALKETFQGNVCHEHNPTSQRSIQLRVINVISRWIKLQYEDFKTDKSLLHRLDRFLINNAHATHLAEDLATLKNLLEIQDSQQEQRFLSTNMSSSLPRARSTEPLERRMNGNNSIRTGNGGGARTHVTLESYPSGVMIPPSSSPFPTSFNVPAPSSTTSFKKVSVNALALSSTSSALASLDAKDVAQYLTLADFNVFKNISSYEYLKGTWRSNNTTDVQQEHDEMSSHPKSGYARILTRRANMLSHWVLHEVCSPENPKQRRMIIRKLMHIAKLCIEWNNFHTGMIIIMGLQCPTIQRLENTWHALSSRDINAFDALQKYLDVTNNMGFYRQSLAAAKAPVIPFFPLILKDLTFFMDGNPTMVTSSSIPSLSLSSSRQVVEQYQQHPSIKLINFDKFRTLTHFVSTLMNYTTVNYWFASDLEHCPFLPHISITRPSPSKLASDVSILDRVAELVEIKIRSVESCYEDARCSNQWMSSHTRSRIGKQVL